MHKSALRRAVGAWAVLAAAALLFGSGIVGNTFASFSAEAVNSSSTFAGGWVGSPTAAGTNFTISGYDVAPKWVAPTTGSVGGYQVWGVSNGTSSNCTGAAYANLNATGLTGTSTTWNHANVGSGAANGNYWCYEVFSIYSASSSWISAAYVLPATQVGMVLKSVAVKGNNAGSIGTGDQILLTYNQPPLSSNPAVCAFTAKVILIGDTSGCASATTDTYTIGKLTTTSTIGTNRTYTTAGSVSGNVLTLTLTGSSSNVSTAATYTWTQPNGTESVKSAATTDQATVCATTATTCVPTASVTTAF